jgi:hypothetical protein
MSKSVPVLWIRIRIRLESAIRIDFCQQDLDPGGQKLFTKTKNKVGCSLCSLFRPMRSRIRPGQEVPDPDPQHSLRLMLY